MAELVHKRWEARFQGMTRRDRQGCNYDAYLADPLGGWDLTLPGDVAASRRYFAPDLIDPEIDVRPDGTIAVPTGPGIGVTPVHDRIAAATEERLELFPS